MFYRSVIISDESEDEKPNPKSKQKKSIGSDVKEVTKNIKNVSISNKLQKKKVDSSEGMYLCYFIFYLNFVEYEIL